MKRIIDEDKFVELFTDGFTVKEIADFFKISSSTVCNQKSKMKLNRVMNCWKCGNQFITKYFQKYKCDLCSEIDKEIYFLRKWFGMMCKRSPPFAKKIEDEIIIEEGEAFREFALDGISP